MSYVYLCCSVAADVGLYLFEKRGKSNLGKSP